jgi:predicted TPR repeat methyltransferase
MRTPAREPIDVLDLGCGTGLCGPLLRPVARRLTGVDLSPGMLDKARERGLYTELECVELTEYLSRRHAEFDLIVAADVFVYVGDLAPVFSAVRRTLRDGGRFAFSVEAAEVREFELSSTRRYRHSRAYVERLAAESGFVIDEIETCVLRRNNGTDVSGLLVSCQGR